MPRYLILLTHDTTESCTVTVDAPTEDAAIERAKLAAYGAPAEGVLEKSDWENDERDLYLKDIYIADEEECVTLVTSPHAPKP